MIVSGFISQLRREYNDLPVKHRDKRPGDGSSTVYKTKFNPIKEGTFKLYINNTLQNASGYTIDLDTGDLELGAPTSNEIMAHYQEVKYRDQHWLEAIKGTVQSFGDKFFKMEIRNTSQMALSAGVLVYDCPSTCIRLTEVLQSDDYTTSGNWVGLGVNNRYDRRANKLILGGKPTRANYLAISYLKRVPIPAATSDTLDVEDNWLEVINLKVGAKFLRSMANRVAQQGNVKTEEKHLNVSYLRQLANDNEVMAENLMKKIKPIMPNSKIPFYIEGGGEV